MAKLRTRMKKKKADSTKGLRADSYHQSQLCLAERIQVLPLFIQQKNLQRSPE